MLEKTNKKLFLIISFLILLIDISFVAVNQYSSKNTLEQSIETDINSAKKDFNLGLSLFYKGLEQLALLISNDDLIRNQFLIASKYPEQTANSREIIRHHLEKSWEKLTEKFAVRQLHFHFAPGSTSFLRIHKPNKFGDNMDDLRHIIVDTNADQKPRTGFELGRVYSGLRATTPVYGVNAATGKNEFAGTLETGTSFKLILEETFKPLEYDVVVLIDKTLVKSKMWPSEFSKTKFLSGDLQCYIEATTNKKIIDIIPPCKEINNQTTVKKNGVYYSVSKTPLFDYQGLKAASPKSIGSIVILKNISILKNQYITDTMISIIYGVLAFIVVEMVLLFGFNVGSKQLRETIRLKTISIEKLKEHYKHQSIIDGLTGLNNRSHFMDRLLEEQQRSIREHTPLSIIMLDIDNFKRVNDTYGHIVGDNAIISVAKIIKKSLRLIDIAGRYGGEEFCIALPNTPLDEAKDIAERMRAKIEKSEIDVNESSSINITASFGVSQWNNKDNAVAFVNTADAALYEAKENGRNQVRIARL